MSAKSTDIPKEPRHKRDPLTRSHDNGWRYELPGFGELAEQASRCISCGVQPCQNQGCNLGRGIGNFNQDVAAAAAKFIESLNKHIPDIAEYPFNPMILHQAVLMAENVLAGTATDEEKRAANLIIAADALMHSAFIHARANRMVGSAPNEIAPPLSLLFTGLTCPEGKCEGSCTTRKHKDGAVSIRSIETAITDYALARGWFKHEPPKYKADEVNYRVAIIGAGPAGIEMAARLLAQGVTVNLYGPFGGELAYGLPPDKLPKIKVAIAKEYLAAYGRQFTHHEEFVGLNTKYAKFNELYNNNDHVFIATGLQEPTKLDDRIVESGHKFVLQGKDVLREYNQAYVDAQNFDEVIAKAKGSYLAQDPHPEFIPNLKIKGKTIVIVGAGDTGMDDARIYLRLGAAKVIVTARGEARASTDEKETALAEGIKIYENHVPKLITELPDGQGVNIKFDNNGKAINIEAAYVVQAIGSQPANHHELFGELRLDVVDGRLHYSKNADAEFRSKVTPVGDVAIRDNFIVAAIASAAIAFNQFRVYKLAPFLEEIGLVKKSRMRKELPILAA